MGERVATETFSDDEIDAMLATDSGTVLELAKDLARARHHRDQWRTYCEGARASVAALTAERDAAYAEMNAVHSLLSLLGVEPTDHYLHAGMAGSLLPRVQALVSERDAVLTDVRVASGECLVPCPEPGTHLARVLIANRLLAKERDAYKRAKAENDERFMLERGTARMERDTALARVKELEVEVARLAPAPVADTGDCRTCKWARGLECLRLGIETFDADVDGWQGSSLSSDSMTRKPNAPRCPGWTKK